ncbi:MAG TPA: MFS transporter [Clostridiales bacterium]|nr:MFS transporter [Clostridiales bacterium]HQP68904.1 MFS transporter [Clostridiales bacterium]
MTSFLDFSGLTLKEKVTLKYHFISSIFEGFAVGILGLNEFVFLKSLNASPYFLGVLFQASIVVMLMSVVFNQFVKRFKDKKKLFFVSILLTRSPLFLAFFFNSGSKNDILFHFIFLGMYFAYCFTTPLIMPILSMMIKQNYKNENFGRLYSNVAVSVKITSLITVFVFGMILDYDNFAFRYFYPLSALLSILSAYYFIKIPYRCVTPHLKTSVIESVRSSLKDMATIIKKNKPFRDFEWGFMAYGLAFMIFTPVMTLYFEKALGLSYSSVSFYKNQATFLSMIFLPMMGRYFSKNDPRKFGIFTFAWLFLFLTALWSTKLIGSHFDFWNMQIYYTVFLAHCFLGLFYASMQLLWDIGSTYFCKNEEVGAYQSIHISLTGFRGIFAPLIGVSLYGLIGHYNTFIVSAALILGAIYIMYYSMKRYPDHASSKKYNRKEKRSGKNID